jgi:high-affinity iron transporter
MKFIFNLAMAGLGLAAGCTSSRPQAPQPSVDGGDAQRLVSLVDYVGRDYGRAVHDGRVVSPEEYDEQLHFLADAGHLAQGLLSAAADEPLRQRIAGIESLVREKTDPQQVARACRNVREQVLKRFGLATSPSDRPSLARAAALYAEACATCHGARGDGGAGRARQLDPAPASFRDVERLSALSPYRVYNTLTFGVPGTAMPAFEPLSPTERWSLAFYVLRLGHEGDAAEPAPAMSLGEMASRSDRDLLEALQGARHPSPRAALAYVRREAPFLEPSLAAGREKTERLLRQALQDFAAGRRDLADRALLDAYLQGFEPLEPRLRVRDSERTREVEAGFRELRVAMARGDNRLVQERARALVRTLNSLGETKVVSLPLLAGLRKLGRPDAGRFIHAGWILALPAGVLTWWVSETVLTLTSDRRELLEAGVAILAAVVLFAVSFWMISKADARRWIAYLRGRLEANLGRERLLLLGGLSFLAVYREAAETVLFTQALLLDVPDRRAAVWLGALLGLLAVCAVAAVMTRAAMRLPLGPFFAFSGILLCALATTFAGSGVYDLVAAGYLPPRPVSFPEIAWLGVHPDLTGLLVQLAIVSTMIVAALGTYRRKVAATARGR